MRFYWFDGKSPQGPFDIPELLAQAGFNGESVVCPVGAELPEDWKPAVNYEPLRDALFKPKPPLLGSPPPVLAPCPACGHPSPDDAIYCSRCGRPLKDASVPPAPRPSEGPTSASPQRPAEPAKPPAGLPGLTLPAPPEISVGPRRGPPPGKMGRIGQSQERQKTAEAPAAGKPGAAAPTVPRPPAASGNRSQAVVLAVSAFVAASAVLGAMVLWPKPKPKDRPAAAAPAAAVSPAAQASVPEVSRSSSAAMSAVAPPPAAPAPAALAPRAAQARPPRKRRRTPSQIAAKPAAPAEPGPASPAKPAEPVRELQLPGIPKKLRTPASKVSQSSAAASSIAAPSSADRLAIDSAKEQFGFCHQLMRQGAFGDFYDSCLCVQAKQAQPYKGRRRVFIEKSSRDPASELGSAVEVVSASTDGGAVAITARWSKAQGTTERAETWAVENGAWCLRK